MKALKIIGALVALLGVLVVGMFIGAALMFQPEPQATDASQRVSNQGDGKSAAGTPDHQQDAAQKEQSSGAKENLPEFGMNEPVDTGDGTVTVTKASKTDVINLSYDKPIEGNFVVVEFEYVSDRPDSVESPWETPFVLRDQDGRTYGEHFDSTNALTSEVEADLPMGTDAISPGVPAEGVTVFEVAPDATAFELGLTDPVQPQDNAASLVNLELSEGLSAPSESSASASASAAATETSTESSSEQVLARADAEAYYSAAATGNYSYTHENLASADQSAFTLEEWIAANQELGSDQASYEVASVTMLDANTADVMVLVNGEPRYTQFVLEDGRYQHALTAEEFDLFASTSI